MSEPSDALLAGSTLATFNSAEERLVRVGFGAIGDLWRFLESWGAGVVQLELAQRPKATVFVLFPPPKGATPPVPTMAAIDALLTAVALAQANNDLIKVAFDGAVVGKESIPDPLRKGLKAGQWLPDDALMLSFGKPDVCICWASGLSFRAYVGGFPVASYADARNRLMESAEDTYRKQGWGDGELLQRCGADDLASRNVHFGIWFSTEHHVLKRRPEELIQERLEMFLRLNMNGFRELRREDHVPNEGRVDLTIIQSDDAAFLVEVKWVGRSIKKEHQHAAIETMAADLKKKWDCDVVTVFDCDDAKKGVAQLASYMAKTAARKGYLAVYDCRTPNEAESSSFAATYPQAAGLKSHQYRIYHVAVDPRSASVKAKGG